MGPLPTAPGQGSSSVGSPTARSSGAAAFGRDLPDAPPYKVYMGNVSYDLTDAAVRDWFRDSRVSGTAVRWAAAGRGWGSCGWGELQMHVSPTSVSAGKDGKCWLSTWPPRSFLRNMLPLQRLPLDLFQAFAG